MAGYKGDNVKALRKEVEKAFESMKENGKKKARLAVSGVPSGSLFIEIREGKRGISASWGVSAYTNGKQHSLGLGTFELLSLKDARIKAESVIQEYLSKGIVRKRDRECTASPAETPKTFRAYFDEWAKTVLAERLKTERDLKRRIASVNKHLSDEILDGDLRGLTPTVLSEFLKPLSESLRDTLRKTINPFYKWCRVKGYWQDTVLPADADVLRQLLTKKPTGHHPMIALEDVPRLFKMLSERKTNDGAVLPLMFQILTVNRSANVVQTANAPGHFLRWKFVNLETALLTIPVEFMKAKTKDHVLPLSPQALTVLRLARLRFTAIQGREPDADDAVFVNRVKSNLASAVSDTLLRDLRIDLCKEDDLNGGNGFKDPKTSERFTGHGARATFLSFCDTKEIQDNVNNVWEASEECLHHVTRALSTAYKRNAPIETMRELMKRWGNHCFSLVASEWEAQATERMKHGTEQDLPGDD